MFAQMLEMKCALKVIDYGRRAEKYYYDLESIIGVSVKYNSS